MNVRLPWYKHYPADHLVVAADLSLQEEGALARMRDWSWCNGPLPHDPIIIAKLIRSPRKGAMVAALIARYFIQTPAGYVDEKIEVQRLHAETKRAHLAAAGAKGGLAKRFEEDGANALANAKQKPLYARSGSGSPGKICTTYEDGTGVEAGKIRPIGGAA